MNENALQRIVVEGPIGVGKRQLAEKLAHHYHAQLFLDNHEENTLLQRFYEAPQTHALAAQLQFLFSRSETLTRMNQRADECQRIVSDFLIEKDRLYALLNLSDTELQLYEKIYPLVVKEATPADLVIYLQAEPDILMKRLKKKNAAFDTLITKDYLKRVVDAFTTYFFNYKISPLLIINTKTLNFLDKDADFLRLVEQIDTMQSGTQYFNPSK